MDEKETVREITGEKKRTIAGVSKVTINAVISLVVVGALILSSFFLYEGTRLKLADAAWWAQKVISGLATFVLMISFSNIVETIAGRKDKNLNDRLDALDEHYQTVMANYEIDNLEVFLENINKANKYAAYVRSLKRKLKHARRRATVKRLSQRLLIDPDELWASAERVRYHKVTYNQLVSGAYDVSSLDDEYDLNVRKAKYGAQKFGWKILTIITCGGVVGDLMYSYIDFTRDMIIPLVFKITTIFVAIYSGVCFGYLIVERTKTVTKKKLRIFSKFRARVKDGTGFTVAIEKDIVVEKIKALETANAAELQKAEQVPAVTETAIVEQPTASSAEKDGLFRKTYDDTFGNHQPVKISGFIKKYIENAIIDDDRN